MLYLSTHFSLSIFPISNVDNRPHGIHWISVWPTEMPAGCVPVSGGWARWERPRSKTLSTTSIVSESEIVFFPCPFDFLPTWECDSERVTNYIVVAVIPHNTRPHIYAASLAKLHQLMRGDGWGCQHLPATAQAKLLGLLVVPRLLFQIWFVFSKPVQCTTSREKHDENTNFASCLFLAIITIFVWV